MKISLDIRGGTALRALRKQIEAYPQAAAVAAKKTVNEAAAQAAQQAANDISQRYTLSAAYVREKLIVWPAETTLNAAVVAKKDTFNKARYGATQITAPAPGAKGDPRRGIPAGRKQAGVSAKILRAGSRKVVRGEFFLPRQRGWGDNAISGGLGMGVFWRWRDEIEQVFTISPSQAYASWITRNGSRITAELPRSFASHFAAEIKRLRA